MTAAALAGAFLVVSTGSVEALTITPIYDHTITSLSNAATIENAFQSVANVFDAEFSTPVTVKIGVSFGNVDGQALHSGDIGGSLIPLLGPYGYTDVTAALVSLSSASPADTALASLVAHLPATDPAKLNTYDIPYAEAQALGFLPAVIRLDSGFIGFKTGVAYDYNPADGISVGAYDFQDLAAHEITEVLGRFSGLPSSGAAQYATPFDLPRYTAPGVNSFNSGAHAFFSIDGGTTDLGNFNYNGSGDRADWLGSTKDSYNAYWTTGVVETLSGNDLTVLDALGYGIWSPSGPQGAKFTTTTFARGSGEDVPEPAAWTLLLIGFGCVGAGLRGRAVSGLSSDQRVLARISPRVRR